jgi:hypothetical protein
LDGGSGGQAAPPVYKMVVRACLDKSSKQVAPDGLHFTA